MQRFLITTLAEYQTVFWAEVGVQLRELGFPVAFLSFDDRSSEMLASRGMKVYSATQVSPPPDVELDRTFKRFGVTKINHWLSHERFAFGITDSLTQRRKLAASLLAANEACCNWRGEGRVVMVQELGGFLSVVGSYFAARYNEVDNWFIEPSFFRGRMFFLRNDFAALQVPDEHDGPTPESVRLYLDETQRSGTIVIPKKDRHQYTTAWKKIVNLRNVRRLLVKMVDKYIHGKRQEFGYIGNHVSAHVSMIWNSFRLRSSYTPLEKADRFVYYPLHVPGDMALTLRSPHLLDQLAIIDLLCRSVPISHCVATKEHPAMVGAVDVARLQELLRRYDNLLLLPPATNNYEVLRKADGVVSINSKSGAEAALLGKPVLVLGDAFYRHSPLVNRLDNLQELPSALNNLLSHSQTGQDREAIGRYFAGVWSRSLPGELYVADPDNVRLFTNSLVRAVSPDWSLRC
jgi:Capsule polysaccharide biosynthesis protein